MGSSDTELEDKERMDESCGDGGNCRTPRHILTNQKINEDVVSRFRWLRGFLWKKMGRSDVRREGGKVWGENHSADHFSVMISLEFLSLSNYPREKEWSLYPKRRTSVIRTTRTRVLRRFQESKMICRLLDLTFSSFCYPWKLENNRHPNGPLEEISLPEMLFATSCCIITRFHWFISGGN